MHLIHATILRGALSVEQLTLPSTFKIFTNCPIVLVNKGVPYAQNFKLPRRDLECCERS